MLTPDHCSLRKAIESRRSVRGFTEEVIPNETLEDIFSLAQEAPSNCNIQPWKTYVATGAAADRLRQRYLDAVLSRQPSTPDYPEPSPFSDEYKVRQYDCARQLYDSMGIERQDKQRRMEAALRNFKFFDAPHVCFIGMDAQFGTTVALDIGMYAQNLMLAMTSYGIGSVAQGALRQHPNIVREFFNIPDNTHILMGLSFGYEDSNINANNTRVGRESVSTLTQFQTD